MLNTLSDNEALLEPLRGEPFSAEHLWEHAQHLAGRQQVARPRRPQRGEVDRQFGERFESNCAFIAEAYHTIIEAVRAGEPIAPDAEWLIDNYYVVEEQLREIREDLPGSFYRELPKLTTPPWKGYPRAFELAYELIAHSDSSLDEELIAGFVAAYQQVTPLTSGEIWAIPIMLRLVLVENLRRLSGHILYTRTARRRAEKILAEWEADQSPPSSIVEVQRSPTLVMALFECLRDSAMEYGLGMHELVQRLGQPQEALDDCVRREQQRLAANQVSIGNVITSMRLLTALDWTQFFERVSLVDQILRRDPAGVYGVMDFASRDDYRHQIEHLAKRSGVEETQVASAVIEFATRAQRLGSGDSRQLHVGYYLLDQGRGELERSLGYAPTWQERIARAARRFPNVPYLGGIVLLTALGTAALVAALWAVGAPPGSIALMALLALLPASELALGLVNVAVTATLKPRMLPKLEFLEHLPSGNHALVVMPTLLTSPQGVRLLLERLEIHYLANPQRGLSYALLTDFADAPQEHMPEDESLLAAAEAGIVALNERYASVDEPRFYLLHRRRTWNAVESAWMGWERKRGKLVELNRLLRGATDTTFLTARIRPDALRHIKYVITLDADTRLPHAAATRLVGAMAHPLNRPYFDPGVGRVTRGYGVLQPRVSVSLASASRSLFAQIFSNGGGLDPYCTAVSDVYQDLFGEGSYTGKGIYDVDAFAAAVDSTFPDNHILSHDLIESCYARCGLVTDTELFDEYPARLEADAKRQHRWIRGDWQLLPWLGRHVPTPTGVRRNPLTLHARWKLFDNLRRSLVGASLMLLLLVGWWTAPQTAWTVTIAACIVLCGPLITSLVATIRNLPTGENWRQQLEDSLASLMRVAVQCGLAVILLPYRAQYMTDAVVRTLYRLFISRRKLLEWETADATERRLRKIPWASARALAWVPFLSIALAFVLPAEALPAATPWLVLWFVSPAIAQLISRPRAATMRPLNAEERQLLRRIARRTWSFFEAFVGPEDHWLPPDNYQEFPKPKVAHRISPTNEGLYVLSALAAHDFGYLGKGDLADLLERNLDGLLKLPRYRGHFYNWYDTTTLTGLAPRYLSTADSGNLAACLLTAQQGLLDLLDEPILSPALNEGVLDTIGIVKDAIDRLQPRGARFVSPALSDLESMVDELRKLAERKPTDVPQWLCHIRLLRGDANRLPQLVQAFGKTIGLKGGELASKIQFLCARIEGLERDAEQWLRWIERLAPGVPAEVLLADFPPPAEGDPWRRIWADLLAELDRPLSLNFVADLRDRLAPHLEALRAAVESPALSAEQVPRLRDWLSALVADVEAAAEWASFTRDRFRRLAQMYESLALEMDFTLLYNPQRRLFTVGYNLDEGKLDRAHYDLLASESRIASLVAIAKGDADHRHWFQLGRALTEMQPGVKGLLSWGGTMFEYMMPPIFNRDVPGSLLERSCRAAVARQIAYGRQHRVPWGISESAFAAQGANSDYHYQSFGVPGLGLKRGLGKDLVVAPYATALAAQVDPAAAAANFRALAAEGAVGPWGYYDAVDFTPERVPPGERRVVVFCYMAHHQGMILAALANCLLDRAMQRRFQRQPIARSIDLLLQERVPVGVLQFQPEDDSAVSPPPLPEFPGPVSRQISTAATNVPRAHLLSNGQYTVMITNAGGGYSSCRGIAISRWRPDTTLDNWGQFVYLRDLDSGAVWSAGHQPTCIPGDTYEVTYSVDKAEIRRRDGDLETHLEVAISPETNAEVRQVTLTNHGRRPATIEVTSYAEVVLSTLAADAAHPAFNKMFVETEYLPECHALLARRRLRDAAAEPAWAVHVLAAAPAAVGSLEYETDRARFLGRGRTAANPAALDPEASLSGTVGPVLDPIFSLRSRLHVGPDESASLAFVTAFAESREEALHLADQCRDPRVVQRMFEMAWAQSQVEMRHWHVAPANVQLFQRLASIVMFPDVSLRAPEEVMRANRRGQRALWRYGISGDDPIVLLQVSEPAHRPLLRELLLAHDFWHMHGLKVDLVVVNEHPAGYFDEFHEQLQELIHTTSRMPVHRPGGVYLLRAAQVAPEDSILLQAAAAVCLHGERGSLARQMEEATVPARERRPELRITRRPESRWTAPASTPESLSGVEFANAYGGFNPEGDYTIHLAGQQCTPMPWANVVANARFGFLITESGGGYTWAGNSRENKLTAWSNDPVADGPSEILYLRDEETGQVWTATPLPVRDSAAYRVEHRRGATQFEHVAHGIRSELLLSIAPRDCVKFACLRVRNESDEPRSLSVTNYVEWVLGVHRQQAQMHICTSLDEATGALVARNHYHEDFPDQTVCLHVLGGADSITGDRTEFLGRNGNYQLPDALRRIDLSGTTGPGLDPCGAVQKKLQLAPGEETELVFLLGWTDGSQSIAELMAPYGSATDVHQAIAETTDFWKRTLATIEVQTPNRALDLLVNHWLVYQVLSCRVWGRSAFYQSGGAYGFRDQLQDVMALVYSLPNVARDIILQAASRQFEEGDVQHWWHPPSGRGVRTRFADDYLWLPYVVSHYVQTTGDAEILSEKVPYLHSFVLDSHEEERYELPEVSSLVEDLYGHCLRAIDHGFRFGPHGLPLMGTGDWNDGMNKVGVGGQGESVWMGWFLRVVLLRFIPLVELRGDRERATVYRREADKLLETIEREAWDGEWYLRAFFDDGTPLGSRHNDECRIDSISQSWSLVAGAEPERTELAMYSLEQFLVRPNDELVLLLSPPFDGTALDPGYIKAYPPGVRENGGQYTHAATWFVHALTLQGRGTRAVEVFDMLNPIRKSRPGREQRYRVEPYVVAADVYSTSPHVGRGGWTWYTGSAAWMYRVALESILGLRLRGDRLEVEPCIPADWPGFSVTLRRGRSTWRINVVNPHRLERGRSEITVDGRQYDGRAIALADDGRDHEVTVTLVADADQDTLAEAVSPRVADESSGNGAVLRRERAPD